MKKLLAWILALAALLCLVSCDRDGGQSASSDAGNNGTAPNGEKSSFPRYTGLDGETEGDGSIQKWAQNCSLAYRYSQIMEGENDFTVWSDAVQL